MLQGCIVAGCTAKILVTPDVILNLANMRAAFAQ
jgi:hypothetical protein